MTPNSDRTHDGTPTGPSDRTRTRPGPDAFVPLTEAAQRLGITYDAARRRIARGTLDAEKRGDRWYVHVAEMNTGPDHDPNARPDAGPDATGSAPDALIAQLRDENAYLRQQLDHQTHIIAGLVQRLPELPSGEPPREDAPVTHESGPQSAAVAMGEPKPAAGLAPMVAAPDGRRVMGEDAPGGRRDENMMTPQEFIALTDDELRRRIVAPPPYESFRHYEIEDYRHELLRREAAQLNARLERLTERLHKLTVWIAIFTVVLVLIELGRIIANTVR
jgi:hypothetical protein